MVSYVLGLLTGLSARYLDGLAALLRPGKNGKAMRKSLIILQPARNVRCNSLLYPVHVQHRSINDTQVTVVPKLQLELLMAVHCLTQVFTYMHK